MEKKLLQAIGIADWLYWFWKVSEWSEFIEILSIPLPSQLCKMAFIKALILIVKAIRAGLPLKPTVHPDEGFTCLCSTLLRFEDRERTGKNQTGK